METLSFVLPLLLGLGCRSFCTTHKRCMCGPPLSGPVSHLGSGISGALSSDKDTEKPCDSCVCPGQIAPLPFFQSFTQRFAVLSPGSRIPVQLALARRVHLGTGWWGSQQQGHGGALLPLAASPLSRLTCPTSQRHQGRTCSISLERVAARAGLCEQTLPHQLSSPGVQ